MRRKPGTDTKVPAQFAGNWLSVPGFAPRETRSQLVHSLRVFTTSWCARRPGGLEDRKHGVPRIADLQATQAAIRFLSVEPLLEDLGKLPLQGISWVIVGGESGPGARPMKEGWVLSIREQCEAANIPFFFKQWGGVRKKVAGRRLLGRTHDGFPYRVQHLTLPARLRLQHASDIESGALVELSTA